MRRLSSKATGRDGDVLSAFIASDGVPCIAVREDDMPLIAAAPEQQAKIDALADALEAARGCVLHHCEGACKLAVIDVALHAAGRLP